MGTVILKLRSGHRKGSEDQLAEVHLHEGETLMGAVRVTFWGALAMGLTAGVGALFGTVA
jgi:hypothetical protein